MQEAQTTDQATDVWPSNVMVLAFHRDSPPMCIRGLLTRLAEYMVRRTEVEGDDRRADM